MDKYPPSPTPIRFEDRFTRGWRFILEEDVAGFRLAHRYRSIPAQKHNDKMSSLAASCQDGQCVFPYRPPDLEENYVFPCERLLRAAFTIHRSNAGKNPDLEQIIKKYKQHFNLHAYQLREGVMIVNPEGASHARRLRPGQEDQGRVRN